MELKIYKKEKIVKQINNISWLGFFQVIKFILLIVVTGWLARYLGPEKFGLYSYSLSTISLFTALPVLGMNAIVVQLLRDNKFKKNDVLSSSLFLQIISCFITFLISIVFIFNTNNFGENYGIILIITAFTLLFRFSEVFRYWFEAKVESKYIVKAELLVIITMSITRILFINLNKEIAWFAILLVFESVFLVIAFIYVFISSKNQKFNWSIDFLLIKYILKRSWPLLISGSTMVIYMKVDQFMLGQIKGFEEVANYAAAAKISDIFNVLPMIFIGSIYPYLADDRQKDKEVFYKNFQKVFFILSFTAIILSISVVIFSGTIINSIYGNKFILADKILRIHIGSIIFVFFNIASSRWYVLENIEKIAMYRSIIGAVLNIVLNYFFITRYGAVGAAYGTLISLFVTGYLSDIIFKESRKLFFIKTIALFYPKYGISILKNKG